MSFIYIHLKKKLLWTKLPNTCTPHRPQPAWHRIPSALPPSPSTLPFFLFLFPSSLPLYMTVAGGALLFVAVAGKARSGLHLFFASCYHFSHLCPHPAPSLPLLLFTPPSLPSSVFLPLTYSNRSGVKWGKARAELTHDTELLTLQLGEPSLQAVSSDTPSVCFRYNNTGFFAFAQTGTQGLKKQQRWTSYKSFVTTEICLLYGRDFIACRSLSLLAFTNKKMRLRSLLLTLRSMLYAEKHFFSLSKISKILISYEKTGTALTHLYILKATETQEVVTGYRLLQE